MITVDYAPGATDAIHRHNAHVFVYVLEGSVVMQVRRGKEVTLDRRSVASTSSIRNFSESSNDRRHNAAFAFRILASGSRI
jgi:Cupin domain